MNSRKKRAGRFVHQIVHLVCLAAALAAWPAPGFAIGTPWLVEQKGNSDADGGIKIINATLKGGGRCPPRLTILITLKGGQTPAQKAKAVCERINSSEVYNLYLTATAQDAQCKIEAKAPCTDIEGVTVKEGPGDSPGDSGTAVKDDQVRPLPNFLAICDLRGRGRSRDGVATLQIGDENPVASVATFRKSAAQIERSLVSAFNSLYSRLGYRAQLNRGRIVIPNVPCPKGVAGGSTDQGIGWEVGLIPAERR